MNHTLDLTHLPQKSKEEILTIFHQQGLMYYPQEVFPFISLQILGEPTAQKRHRSVRMGSFNRQYDPSASDKADFLSIVHNNAPETPLSVPLRVELCFYFSRPKSHYRTGKNAHLLKDNPPLYHTSRNDVDNLAKFVFDALNKVYWKDDSFISECYIKKIYDEKPRTEINIYTL